MVFTLVNASFFWLQLRAESGGRVAITPLLAIALCVLLLGIQTYVRLTG